jgi:hypothetical protein
VNENEGLKKMARKFDNDFIFDKKNLLKINKNSCDSYVEFNKNKDTDKDNKNIKNTNKDFDNINNNNDYNDKNHKNKDNDQEYNKQNYNNNNIGDDIDNKNDIYIKNYNNNSDKNFESPENKNKNCYNKNFEMINLSKKHLCTPDIRAVESDVIPIIDISNSLKNDSTSNLNGFERNLNINLDRRYFTEYNVKDKINNYRKIESFESNRNTIKPINNDKEIHISEGNNNDNNQYDNGR